MASQQAATETLAPLSKYSKRVILKTVLEGGTGLVGQTIVIGGWVKSSNEVRKEPLRPPAVAGDTPAAAKDVTCVEILQTRIPFFRSIMKVLGGNPNPGRGKLESIVQQLPPPPSVAVLQVSDGSCVPSLQVHFLSVLFIIFCLQFILEVH